MTMLRRLSLRAAALIALPGAALAHPGHGVDATHGHGEWIALAVIVAVVGGVALFARRTPNS